MDSDSLLSLGLAVMCQACESEIDVLDEQADRGICRHCGMGFLLDGDSVSARTA